MRGHRRGRSRGRYIGEIQSIGIIPPLGKNEKNSLMGYRTIAQPAHTPREPGGVVGPDAVAHPVYETRLGAVGDRNDIVDEKGTDGSGN